MTNNSNQLAAEIPCGALAANHEPFLERLTASREFFTSGAIDYREESCGFATVFTAEHNLGKEYSLANGALQKRTLGALGECRFGVTFFDTAEEFAGVLLALTSKQVLTASTPRGLPSLGRIVKKEDVRSSLGCISRGKEHFGLQSGQRSVLTIDYDPSGLPLNKAELWGIIREAIPGADQSGVVYWPSSSSHIFHGETELNGVRGQRIYILVRDAGDVKRAMGVLQRRLWLNGHGRVMISAAGSMLLRTPADETLAEDAKLDYAGGAVCRNGLDQRRPPPEVLSNGGFLDTAVALPNLSPAEIHAYEQLVATSKRAAEPEAESVRQAWALARGRHYAEKAIARGMDYKAAHDQGIATAQSALKGVLLGDFEIELDDGDMVTVGQILDDRARYHMRLTKDPLEPDYRGGHIVGRLHLFGSVPNLFSFAHGRVSYRLDRQPARVLLQSGRTSQNALEYVRRLAEAGDVFSKGGVPVRVFDGLKPLTSSVSMGLELGSRFAAFKMNAKGEPMPADPSDALLKMVIEAGAQSLPKMKAYVKHPWVGERGVVSCAGFHAEKGIFADFDPADYAGIPANPSRGEITDALETLWRAWSRFAFATVDDRAAMLAAILGIVCRPGLDIAPGVLFDAPVAGSGKTFGALALGAISSGVAPSVCVYASGESDIELKKRLISGAIAGESTFLYDNVMGFFNSAALAGCLTSGSIRDRVLGASLDYSGEGPQHVLLTSNNCLLGPDLAVRFLRVRLDHGVANPASIFFDFHPVERALNEREDVLRACLVVMQGFIAAGSPHHGMGGYRMAAWDRLVRSAVIWLGKQGLVNDSGIAEHSSVFDPAAGLLAATDDVGSGDEVKAEWLRCLKEAAQGGEFTVLELLRLTEGSCALSSATLDALSGRPLTTSSLRGLLQFNVGVVAGGLRLTKFKNIDKSWAYTVY